MKNSMGKEFDVQRKGITFTQLGGKYLKCNDCDAKVTRAGLEAHRNSHNSDNKRFEPQVSEVKSNVGKIIDNKPKSDILGIEGKGKNSDFIVY